MEQNRQLSAMKKHIEKLEGQLHSVQTKGNNVKSGKTKVRENLSPSDRASDSRPNGNPADAENAPLQVAVSSNEQKGKTWKNIVMKHLKSKKLFAGSTETRAVSEINVHNYMLDVADGLEGKETQNHCQLNMKDGIEGFGDKESQSMIPRPVDVEVGIVDIEVTKGVGIVDIEATKEANIMLLKKPNVDEERMQQQQLSDAETMPDVYTVEQVEPSAAPADSAFLNDALINDADLNNAITDSVCTEPQILADLEGNKGADSVISGQGQSPRTTEVDNSSNEPKMEHGNKGQYLSTSTVEDSFNGRESILEKDVAESELGINNIDPGRTNEINNISRLSELELLNQDLKTKISSLEEEIWLANEDKQNMQVVLERQKDKAIKNLALKFEKINKKTLGEFKGIFERRLREINAEKLLLQEKLEKIQTQKDGKSNLVNCEMSCETPEVSEENSARLERENISLKQRCRKLSANLGKVTKESRKISLADASTETDLAEADSIATQTPEDTLQSSINCLQTDVKDIAVSICALSENLPNKSRTWSEYSFEKRNSTDGSCGSELQKLEAISEKNESKTTDFSEISNQSDTSYEIVDDNNSGEKVVNFSGDDSDSGIFGNDLSPVAENDLESQLYRIEDKYRKITTELDNYDRSRLGNASEFSKRFPENLRNIFFETSQKVRPVRLQFRQNESMLDPEIQRIIKQVNRQYNEYFNGNTI